MGICAIGAKLLPHPKAKIRDSLSTRRAGEKLPIAMRGNIVIRVLEGLPGQAGLTNRTFDRSADISQKMRKRTQHSYPVYRYRLRTFRGGVFQ